MTLTVKMVIEEFSKKYDIEYGERYMWSPYDQKITLPLHDDRSDQEQLWSLLHEIGHAESGHEAYQKDIELIRIEAEAWGWAERYVKRCGGLDIEADYIEDCLDSYRDWLHVRSKCPQCSTTGIETAERSYRCYNCMNIWKVPQSPLCNISKRSVGVVRG